MRLFRYYKAQWAIRTLTDLEIRTSIPSELNDPFELSPNIDPSQFTQERIEAILCHDHIIDEYYDREAAQSGFSNKEDYKRCYFKDLSERAAQVLESISKNVEADRKSFADNFSRHWRIVCASLVDDSILMWSHYADNHTGVVLEFDTGEPPFSEIGNDSILTVKYSDRKPDYTHFDYGNGFKEEMYRVAATKAIDWAYEKEVRIVIAANALRDRLYLPLTATCIKGIRLGCRASSETQVVVLETLAHPQFRHVRVARAELHPSQYALTFRDISQGA